MTAASNARKVMRNVTSMADDKIAQSSIIVVAMSEGAGKT
jgi:hypothetical protein